MRWIKRVEPLILSQESDIPYIVNKNGVFLCYDNAYKEGPSSSKNKEPRITFKTNINQVKRKSSCYFKFIDFPVLIPFSEIIELNKDVLEKEQIDSDQSEDSKSIAIIKGKFISKLKDEDFHELEEELNNYDKTFILIKDDIDSNSRSICDTSTMIYHTDWGRTCVTIADSVCNSNSRNECWTKNVPYLDISTYGLNSQNVDDLYRMFMNIDIEVSTRWVF